MLVHCKRVYRALPLTPQYVSFWVFFMSYEVGERLAFGITLILAVEVSKGLVINLVPICGELLWVEIFLNLNLLFCLLALFETCVVLFLAFHTEAGLLPEWVTALYAAAVHAALPPALARRIAPASPFDDPMDDEARREPSFGARFFRRWNAQRSAGGSPRGSPTPLRPRSAGGGTPTRTAAADWESAGGNNVLVESSGAWGEEPPKWSPSSPAATPGSSGGVAVTVDVAAVLSSAANVAP